MVVTLEVKRENGARISFRVDSNGQPYYLQRTGDTIIPYDQYGRRVREGREELIKNTYPVNATEFVELFSSVLRAGLLDGHSVDDPLSDLD